MYTTKNPTHCPRCMSKNVSLYGRIFKKDINGNETKEVILGEWKCDKCGNLVGRRVSQYENDLDPNSL